MAKMWSDFRGFEVYYTLLSLFYFSIWLSSSAYESKNITVNSSDSIYF